MRSIIGVLVSIVLFASLPSCSDPPPPRVVEVKPPTTTATPTTPTTPTTPATTTTTPTTTPIPAQLSATPPAAGACDFTLASCEPSCAAGDGVSCYRLGRLLSSDYFGARNEPRAAQLFAAACAAGVGDACNAIAAGVRDDEHDGARAAALFEKACEMNSAKACLNGGTLRAHYPAFADVPKARAMYDRGCALDQPAAIDCCFELGGVLQASGDADGARAAFTKACAQGDEGACTKLAALGGTPPVVTPDERARRAATNCDLGVGAACYTAAMALEKARDLDGALRLYDKGCALQGLDACGRLAFALGGLEPAAGFAADAEKAARAAQSGCVLARNFKVPGGLRLCKLFSTQQASGSAAVDDVTSPGDLFYCEQNGKAESCAAVGYRIANGQGQPADPAKATSYLDRACKGGSARGCALILRLRTKLSVSDAFVADAVKRGCALGEQNLCRDPPI